ncbi:MAG: diguanylate cyclase [Deltaproteobacteria bacterium]|nr:MAG: diguanylate cyclase [Deltaproteobacteria bacterium]
MARFLRRRLGRKTAVFAGACALLAAGLGLWLSGTSLRSSDALVLLSAVAAAVVGTVVAVRILVLRRLERLARVMKKAEAGDFLVRAQVDSDDEIGELARAFNTMLAEITDMAATQIDSDREREMMKRELDLKAQLAEKSEELSQRVRELTLLIEVGRELSSSLEVTGVLSRITQMVGVTLGFNEFALLLYEEENREYVITEAYGFDPEAGVEGLRFRDDEGVISIVHERRDTVLIPDTTKEPRYLHYKGARKGEGSLLVVPMLYRDKIIGALSFMRPEVDAFRESEVALLEAVARQAALAISNAQLYQRTVELSLTDPLTGTYNRRHLESRLEMEVNRARRFEHALSAIMIDIDHFKHYNDTHGHPMGDRILQEVARILGSQLRRVDTLARYGGEEFTVLLPRVDKAQALEVAEKLRQAVEAQPFPGAEAQPLGRVTLSLGVATFPDDAASGKELLSRADDALYEAKAQGRNRVVAYAPGLAAAPPSRGTEGDGGSKRGQDEEATAEERGAPPPPDRPAAADG